MQFSPFDSSVTSLHSMQHIDLNTILLQTFGILVQKFKIGPLVAGLRHNLSDVPDVPVVEFEGTDVVSVEIDVVLIKVLPGVVEISDVTGSIAEVVSDTALDGCIVVVDVELTSVVVDKEVDDGCRIVVAVTLGTADDVDEADDGCRVCVDVKLGSIVDVACEVCVDAKLGSIVENDDGCRV